MTLDASTSAVIAKPKRIGVVIGEAIGCHPGSGTFEAQPANCVESRHKFGPSFFADGESQILELAMMLVRPVARAVGVLDSTSVDVVSMPEVIGAIHPADSPVL